ncbi:MAG: PilW family protein, partial [Gammaproteobacteria bacterium]
TVYINSNKTQRLVQDQIATLDGARFALDAISYDLRQAGIFGRRAMVNNNIFLNTRIAGVSDECYAGWVSDVDTLPVEPIRAFNDTTPYLATCTKQYAQGDVIEMRYTHGVPVGNLLANTLYLNGSINQSQFFIGTTSPNLDDALDFQVVAHAYYISNFSDQAGDGIPSLHRVALQTGATAPVVVDEMLLSGVLDLQVQFGIDRDRDEDNTLDAYVTPGDASLVDNEFLFAQIWIVVQSTEHQPQLDTSASFNIAGNTVVYANDGYRKTMLSTVVKVRNYY